MSTFKEEIKQDPNLLYDSMLPKKSNRETRDERLKHKTSKLGSLTTIIFNESESLVVCIDQPVFLLARFLVLSYVVCLMREYRCRYLIFVKRQSLFFDRWF